MTQTYIDWYDIAQKAAAERKYASEKEVTRLVIFEDDPEEGRSVYDIIEWDGILNIISILSLLPKVKRLGCNYLQTERHWRQVINKLGTYEMPFVIEYARVPK